MLELIEKIFLTGLGAMSISQKKADEILGELKEKYKMSEEEGRALLQKAESVAREGKDRLAEAVDDEVKKVLEKIGMVSRDEFESLRKRVEQLEEKMGKS
jgi:polyhydroxyalkanoate synthesis regulator phasin